MIDFDKECNSDKLKFLDHFPRDGDITLQILKGHLLLEETLREILVLQLPHAHAISGEKGASFTCHQVICLCEALTPVSDAMPWIWAASKKLNNLRNDLAHQLNPPSLNAKAEALINYIKTEDPEIGNVAKEINASEGNELAISIVSMCSCLSSLKAVITHMGNAAHNNTLNQTGAESAPTD